jgi:quinol---cytochrome c reductase cytochrome b subunit, bacillus type
MAVNELAAERPVAAADRGWVMATRVALGVVGVLLVVLVVTGVMLVFQYRPNVSAAYGQGRGISKTLRVRAVHRDASILLLPAVGALFIAAGGLALVRHRPARLVWPLLVGVMAVAASVTGYLLPWDQLALWRVTVGENLGGYRRILFHQDVNFVLIGDKEIARSTLARWVWVHAVGISVVLIALVVVIGLMTRPVRERSASRAGARE